MTQRLTAVIDELQKLPDEEQDAIAAVIQDELADESRWQAKFAATQDQLARWAAKVRDDIRAGRTRPGGFDEL